MKKLILKTALITFLAACVVFLAVSGLLSLAAPVTMMNFTASLGMDGMSSDYAYEAYTRSDDLDLLARSAEVSFANGSYQKADERFEELMARKDFVDYCNTRDESAGAYENTNTTGTFAAYIYSSSACAKYYLAVTDEEKAAVIGFAIEKTDGSFPEYNAVISLAVEARRAADKDFCKQLATALEVSEKFDGENTDLKNVKKFLEDFE